LKDFEYIIRYISKDKLILRIYMFSTFRELMNKWDNARKLMIENNLCLFFKKDGRIYASTEDGRLTFARMKNPDAEDKAWAKDATFDAYDLEKTYDGNETRVIFGMADMPDIKIIDEKKVAKIMKKKGKQIPKISEDEPLEEK